MWTICNVVARLAFMFGGGGPREKCNAAFLSFRYTNIDETAATQKSASASTWKYQEMVQQRTMMTTTTRRVS
jgi:hypothetical protein